MRRYTVRCYNSIWLLLALFVVVGGLTALGERGDGIAVGEKGESIAEALSVTREAVLQGEVWRLVTYAFIHRSLTGLLFHGLIFYFIAAPLELTWGTPRFLTLVALSILGGGITAVAVNLAGGNPLDNGWALTMTLMLIHGFTFPDSRIHLFFVLPIRVKTLALVAAGLFLLGCLGSGPKGIAYFAGMLVGVIYYVISTRSVLWARKAKRKLVGSSSGSPGLLKGHTTRRLMEHARDIVKKHDEGAELSDEDRTYIEALIERSDPSKELCSPYSFSPDNEICPPCTELGRCLRRTIYGETKSIASGTQTDAAIPGPKPDGSAEEEN